MYIHVESVQVQITPLQYYDKDIDLYTLLCDIRYTKFNNQIIIGIKTNSYGFGMIQLSAWVLCESKR